MTKILIAIYMLIPIVLTNSAQAGSIGRLFFTPEQRAQLEAKRAHNAATAANSAAPVEPSNAEATEAAEEENDTPSVLMVNGIVQKQGGHRTVWINGVPQNAGGSDEHHPESVPVSVPGKPQPVKVKVGQQLLLDNPAQHKTEESKPAKQNTSASAPQKQPASDD